MKPVAPVTKYVMSSSPSAPRLRAPKIASSRARGKAAVRVDTEFCNHPSSPASRSGRPGRALPGIRMADLKAKFEKAAEDIKKLKERPDNDTLLKLYALYKQGSEGDVSGPKPGFFD